MIIRIFIVLVLMMAWTQIKAQKFATIDGGERIIVYADGTWTKIGEAKPEISAPQKEKIVGYDLVGTQLVIFSVFDGLKEKNIPIDIIQTKKDRVNLNENRVLISMLLVRVQIGKHLFEVYMYDGIHPIDNVLSALNSRKSWGETYKVLSRGGIRIKILTDDSIKPHYMEKDNDTWYEKSLEQCAKFYLKSMNKIQD